MFTKKYEDVIELLKIKDDIDKTYLKKLGFEDNSKCYFKHISNAWWCIRKKDNIIECTACGDWTKALVVLFDLITNNMVEKIEVRKCLK